MNYFCIAAIYPLTDDQGDTKFILEIPGIAVHSVTAG